MSKEEKMKPEIRFEGFEGEWESRCISDILSVNSGYDYKHLQPGDIPVYGTGGYMLSVDKALSHVDAIGIGRKGTIDKPQFLKAPFWTVDTLFYLTLEEKDFDLNFMYFFMKNINWKKYDESTGVPSLSKTQINKITVRFPSSKEQEKIGNYFNNLDKNIQSKKSELEKFKQFKQAMLQKMFPKEGEKEPEIRFEGFDGEWKKYQLSEIVSKKSLKSNNASIKRIEYEDIVSGTGMLNSDWHGTGDSRTGIVFNREDILYGYLRPYLKNWYYADFEGKAIGDFWVLDSLDNDSKFIYFLVQTSKFQVLSNLSSGSKMPRADWKLVSKSEFYIPFLKDEQKKIGDFFMQLEKNISAKEKELAKLQNFKQAMLDKMFV